LPICKSNRRLHAKLVRVRWAISVGEPASDKGGRVLKLRPVPTGRPRDH
jgi:hypothetical protein